ncbi:putative small heat shock protein HSP20 [Rosa chinensis]|uniref:Putative small heat shock protein HSP20 n=1 Tax=Rosa chinensis TaxID=74649 RepID=A0A2P6SMD2_ROSCH|nr:heat shock 22 kDa protein, mitochondrial [Rosa chinensis]PRQ59822.1 putative small heat shock protein HSP20 [Rosa chinensis]
MASSLALRRFLFSNLLPKPLSSSAFRPIRDAKLFNTNAARHYDSDESDETDLDSYRRHDCSLPRRRDNFISDVFAPPPFSVDRNLSQVLNLVDQISENPFLSATRRGWDARETEDGLHLRFEMPGLGKEDVKVWVEKNTLVIRGEGGHVDGEEEPRRYSTGIQLPEKMFKTDGVKAEMKNGVLRVVVPKIKEEERSDVFHVRVE